LSQVKVFEFAKQVGLETLVLMDKIKEWKLPIKSHMAVLDDSMVETIKNRLQEETAAQDAVKPKGKAKAKAAPKAAAAKAAPEKKAVTKTSKAKAADEETPAAKPVAKKIVKKSAAVAAAPVAAAEETAASAAAKKSSVIRRKAGEIPPKPEELAPQTSADGLTDAALSADGQAISDDQAPVAPVEAPKGPQPISSPGPAPQRRTNIIGRMDLSKARAPAPTGGAGSAADRNRPGGQQRNIRTGFVAAPTMFEPTAAQTDFDEERRREKEREKKKAAGAGGGREEEVQLFNASDFRKREVIFQPKKKKIASGIFKKTELTTPKASKRIVYVDGTMKVSDLSQALGVKTPILIKKIVQGGMMATPNTELDFDTVALLASEFEFEATNIKKSADELLEAVSHGDMNAEKIERPPVVTVMGHVDHGKTSLLDAIRKADVVSGEAGGITQHIGAYKVKLDNGRFITFLDTPGHEAFTAMRARGANVTDVAIVVVAADDGVMPQTAEAINHAKAAGVPIIIAVNKIDKPGADVGKIKQQLTEFEIVPEEWGGTNIFCEVSAKNKTGISELLEQILLVSEVEDLKANPKRAGTGTVVEARLEKGRGPVATLLVSDGTIRIGDSIVAGTSVGRVRAMMNDKGEQVKTAEPGDPVEVLGFSHTPDAGDAFACTGDEDTARKIAETRKQEADEKKNKSTRGVSLEDLYGKVQQGEVHELPIILKADVSGSLEAIRGMLEKVNTSEVKVKVIHTGVGGITESDVLLAASAKGLIIGFNVRPDSLAASRAKEKAVEIKNYNIVYNLVDDMKKAMGGLLKPTLVEKVQGRAEVRNVFSVPKMGNIGGCAVTDGKINRSDSVRLLRDNVVVYEGKIGSLRRFKDDVKEVATGYECGIGIENYNDMKVGDVIEAFVIESITRSL
jgi:translation initiation factor IF-2